MLSAWWQILCTPFLPEEHIQKRHQMLGVFTSDAVSELQLLSNQFQTVQSQEDYSHKCMGMFHLFAPRKLQSCFRSSFWIIALRKGEVPSFVLRRSEPSGCFYTLLSVPLSLMASESVPLHLGSLNNMYSEPFWFWRFTLVANTLTFQLWGSVHITSRHIMSVLYKVLLVRTLEMHH